MNPPHAAPISLTRRSPDTISLGDFNVSGGENVGGILVVDDDPSIRMVLSSVLEDEGHAVIEASNGAEALDLASQHSPRLILLDMRMPIMDGWQFARSYRERPGPHAPIVVMTAAQNARQWCAEVKGQDCLPKPFELDHLLETVQRFAA